MVHQLPSWRRNLVAAERLTEADSGNKPFYIVTRRESSAQAGQGYTRGVPRGGSERRVVAPLEELDG